MTKFFRFVANSIDYIFYRFYIFGVTAQFNIFPANTAVFWFVLSTYGLFLKIIKIREFNLSTGSIIIVFILYYIFIHSYLGRKSKIERSRQKFERSPIYNLISNILIALYLLLTFYFVVIY